MEKQEKAFCLVHSFNMAIGEHISSGKQVLAHIQKMEDTLEQRKVYNQSLDHFYTKHMSNFHSNILNHFLHHLPWNNGKIICWDMPHLKNSKKERSRQIS